MNFLRKFIPIILIRIIKKLFIKFFNNLDKILYKKNFKAKIIFFISAIKESSNLINHNYRLIFKNKIDYNKLKKIFSLPRSGTHYSMNVLDSYLEQLYNIGNGEGKVISNTFLPEEKLLVYGANNELKENLITKIEFLKFNFSKFKRPNILNEINYDTFYCSHHPIQYDNLIDFNKIKAVVLIRNPLKAVSSLALLYFNHRLRDNEINIENLDNYRQIIFNRCDLVIRFINYWNNFKKNKENFLFIKYDELINNPHNSFLKILNFYKIEINENYLSISIKFNSKENLDKISFVDFKTITHKDDFELKDCIEKIAKEYFLKKNFDYKNYFKI